MSQLILYVIIGILVFDYFVERTLDYLDIQNWKKPLPAELSDIYTEGEYKKAKDYDLEKTRFSFISSTFSLALMLLVLFIKGFGLVDSYVSTITIHPIGSALLFFAIIALASDVLSLPFSLYSTFVIEEKYGFNRTTVKTYISDKVKGYVLGGLIGGGLLSLFIWFYMWAGTNFWIYTWIAFGVFILLLTMFYSSVILPVFNKLNPLPEGDLRSAIENYCSKVGFKLENLFVMNGSKRSSKANAFFTGLGKKKTIVLYDTLIEKQTTEELVSVLAHEIGHYKKKHTLYNSVLALLQLGLMLYLLSLFLNNPEFSIVLGAERAKIHLGLITFALLFSPISMILGIFKNILSRKFEYEADRFAAETYEASYLQSALKKLSVNNLSNLNPHPLNIFIHYSHPPLLARLRALKGL
jgi:STE24 endopeptidase